MKFMTQDRRQACDRLVRDLRRIFGPRLQSCVAYGPGVSDDSSEIATLALVDSLTAEDLAACAALAAEWRDARLTTPLILPREEFRRSLDAFPLEYSAIHATQTALFGEPPFDGLAIAPEDVRRACEVQVKSHLLHLREGYIEAGGDIAAVARLVVASAAPLLALLQNLARLEGITARAPIEVAHAAAEHLGVPGGIVGDILALAEQGPVPTGDPARLFPAYLALMDTIARRIDDWRS